MIAPDGRISCARTLATLFAAGAFAGVACNSVIGNEPATLASDGGGGLAIDASTQSQIDPGSVGPNGIDASMPAPADDSSGPDDGGGVSTTGTDASTAGGCGTNQKMCAGECVTLDDPTHGCAASSCKGCDVPHAVAACSAGACAVASCADGFGDCNGDPSDGCEADFSKPATCGGCHSKCAGTTPNCMATGASFACTLLCPLNAPILCGKECANLLTDVAHCGACNTSCAPVIAATVSCVGGACEFACAPGHADCDGIVANGCEASLQDDKANCGACGVACGKGTCSQGACKMELIDAGSADAGGGAGGGDTPDAGLDAT
jgi:hypothetical protein